MDYYSDSEPTTTEQLTVVQINQLKDAWQRANAELVKYKDIALNLQQKVENLTSVINESYNQLELEAAKSQLSQQCCSNPSKPVLLVKELSRFLPKLNYHSLVATAFIKTGESWIALSSSTVTQETIHFKSRIFEEMLRFRSRSKTSKVIVESLPNILPLPVINYIHSGTVPATESAFDIFNDESKGHGNINRRSERTTSPAETLYHEAIILRLSGPDSSEDQGEVTDSTSSERCVWVLTVAPQYQSNSGVDIYTDEIPMRRLAVEQFGAHAQVLNGVNDMFGRDSRTSGTPSTATDFWFPLLDYSAQIVMTALLHQFEAKRMYTQVLQSEAVAEFTELLSNATACSDELILEEAGVTSLASSAQLLETMSQRSEEDDIIQGNTLLDDAYWDKVWQLIPGSLEEFITQHVEGLGNNAPVSGTEESQEPSARVQRFCRCEVYIGSSMLIDEVNKQQATASGADAVYMSSGEVVTEIPIVNSKRVVSMLRLRESDNIDGHVDALDTVLRAALMKDTAAVQSYSEVSFQERSYVGGAVSAASAVANKSSRSSVVSGVSGVRSSGNSERGPHVEFHTVIAVPLLRKDQQDAFYEHMTSAEEHEMGAVKGCVLVHVTSVLIETASNKAGNDDAGRRYGGLSSRAHPMYTSSFSANSTSTHSAYMEQIAGSYNLLESGRQPLVSGVLTFVDVIGGMVLAFLHAHNCRPLNFLPMGPTGGGGWGGSAMNRNKEQIGIMNSQTGAGARSSSVISYSNASRWNNCITDGLFSLLLPPHHASAQNNSVNSSVAPSLESLAYVEESKASSHAGFRPLSQDHIIQHNARTANGHGALMHHLCTLFHSDWALVFIAAGGLDSSSTPLSGPRPGSDRNAHWAMKLNSGEDEEVMLLRVINNIGESRCISAHELPSAYRSLITQNLSAHRGGHRSSSHGHHAGSKPQYDESATHEFVKDIAGAKALPLADLLPLLRVDEKMKHSIHELCDSNTSIHLHHTAALCLDPHSAVAVGAHANKRSAMREARELLFPTASSIVILTGRFLRGPFYAPFSSTPSVSQLNLLFQTALARRDLLVTKETVHRLLEEKALSMQEAEYAKTLEERLATLQETTLSGKTSNIASLVSFRKGLLGVLIEFFSDLHRMHYASYMEDTSSARVAASASNKSTMALEVIGIELVVDESTGLEEGRHRKWALSASTADWVRVHANEDEDSGGVAAGSRSASAFQRSSRKKIVQVAPVQHTLHSQLTSAEFNPPSSSLTAEVFVDSLVGVYEEKGAAVLHVHRKHKRYDDEAEIKQQRRNVSDDLEDEEEVAPPDLIGMLASINVHYEHPVVVASRSGRHSTQHGQHSSRNSSLAQQQLNEGRFFTTLQSFPSFMRILRNFIASNSQALFQPLYPIYTPLKLQHGPFQHISIDEEQQWEDEALYAQASNLAINALSSTIVHDSTKLLSSAGSDGLSEEVQQHPHYRYLHQQKLLRQLTVVPPFSAFMLIPIRELTTTEVSAFDDDSSSSDSSVKDADLDVEDVRYIHLLPTASSAGAANQHGSQFGAGVNGVNHRRKSSANHFAQCVLPMRLNESVRDAVRSARDEQSKAEETAAADAIGSNNNIKGHHHSTFSSSHTSSSSSHRIRTSRLTVLDGGMGGVLHNYLSDLHEKQQRRRTHNNMHRGNHEFDLYGYVDVGSSSAAERVGARNHTQEIALVDQHSMVLLYTPLLHSSRHRHAVNGLNAIDDDDEGRSTGMLTGDTNAALDHYYLVVCRQDRMIVPSSLVRLQTCLDELFLPSRVLAASQPWFECMTGIEQLIKAATASSAPEFKAGAAGTIEASTHEQSLISTGNRFFPSAGEPHTPPRHQPRAQMHVDVPSEIKFNYSASSMSAEGQCQRILMETITVMKRIVGDRCLGAVGYQLRVSQDDLPELISSTSDMNNEPSLSYAVTSDTYRTGKEIELVRCCSDVGLVSSRSGKVMTMMQGPSKLQCPATAGHIESRFSVNDLRNHHTVPTVGYSPQRGSHHRHHSHAHAQEFAIHYVEMSSLEHIKQLQHSATSGSVVNNNSTPKHDHSGAATPTRARRTTNVAAVQEVLNAAHLFLRADVRVLQLLITASPSQEQQVGDIQVKPHVVASVLLYLSQSAEFAGPDSKNSAETEESANADSLPAVTYFRREDILQQLVAPARTSSTSHRQHSSASRSKSAHASCLSKGILSCVMRVGDTAGALVSSLYKQQYDSYLHAYITRCHQSEMHIHAQRLANTLLRIDHELSSVVQVHPEPQQKDSSFTSPSKAKKHSPPAKNFHFENTETNVHSAETSMTQFVSDTEQQKEVAERALDCVHVAMQQIFELKQQFVEEQQTTTEIRCKLRASTEECRTKATQFRAFFEAVKAACAILPPPQQGPGDLDSINSGLDKVAEHNATVPDHAALQTAVANAACNTHTLRKALEVLSELSAHEEFAGFFNSMFAALSECTSGDASEIASQLLSASTGNPGGGEDGYDQILQLLDETPYALTKRHAVEGANKHTVAPDVTASVWWVLEPGSHVNAINLANSVQISPSNALDVNTLHSKEKFVEALNSKKPVLVEGEELLRMLPHLLAYFSANGRCGVNGKFPSIRLLYQPILAALPSEQDLPDDISYSSAEESHSEALPRETVVVAVVQYVMCGGAVGASAASVLEAAAGIAALAEQGHNFMHDDGSSIGVGSAAGHTGPSGLVESALSSVMRQVGRDRVEQAIAYMGQHVTFHSKIVDPSVAAANSQQISRSTRYTQSTLAAAMNQYVPRLLQENNLISGIQYTALISTLRYIMDPVSYAPPAAPPVPSSHSSKDSSSHSSQSHTSGASRRSKSVTSSSRKSVGSVRSASTHSRSRDSHRNQANNEKIRAAAVYTPISVWVGKLLATMMRADAASMLHITGSVKTTPKARTSSNTTSGSSGSSGSGASSGGYASAGNSDNESASAAERSTVVYEGVLYQYQHGAVLGGSVNDERQALNILHVRPSSWTPLQSLIDKYHTFFRNNNTNNNSNNGEGVFVTYQESVLSYTRRAASGGPVYSSRSATSASVLADTNSLGTSAGAGAGKMRYILASSISTSSVNAMAAHSSNTSHSSSSSANANALSRKNVHFVDNEEGSGVMRSALKENDDFIIVELSRRPTSADLKAFSAISQLVQAYIWGQTQRNTIKSKETELSSISGALATTSQRLVEEQFENQLHQLYSALMQELQRQMGRSQSERSLASVSSVSSAGGGDFPVGGEFTPRVSDILHCVQRSQDLLCEVLGDSDSVSLLPVPRMICEEVRNLLRSDTLSVASRSSSAVDDELMGSRIDTVSRNFSKRALARIMAVDYHPGPSGVIHVTEFQEAAAAQYELARRKFSALAVQLNQVIVCDVGDVIVEEAINLNINISKTTVPEIARSIMIPIIDHALEPAVATTAEDWTSAGKGSDFIRYSSDLEDQLPTSRLRWLDSTLQEAVEATLSSADKLSHSSDIPTHNAYYMQHYFPIPSKVRAKNAAVTSTCQNSAHAWALQVVFPTLEARDDYVTVLLGGPSAQHSTAAGNLSQLSTPTSSPPSSPVKGGSRKDDGFPVNTPNNKEGKASFLPIGFVAGISQFLKNSFVHCRNYVREDVSLLQARFEQAISSRVSECMDQVLLLTSPPESDTTTGTELDMTERATLSNESIDFSVDTIAASVAHVFGQLKGKLPLTGKLGDDAEGDSSSDDEHPSSPVAAPTAAAFECFLEDAQMHWVVQPSKDRPHMPSVRFQDSSVPSDSRSSDLCIGTWYTVALNDTTQKTRKASSEDKEVAASTNKAPVPVHTSNTKRAKAVSVEVSVEQEFDPISEGYKVKRDDSLYQRCQERQWRTQRSALSNQHIQALKDRSDGFLLLLLPAVTPHHAQSKPKRTRSSSPIDKHSQQQGSGGTAAPLMYSSSAKNRQQSMFASGSFGDNQDDDANNSPVGVGAYMNSDGSINLQLLVFIAGSEQPAILELRMKCHLTSGACCPNQLIRQLHRRRSRKNQPVPVDELALAEMIEQIACRVLQPTLPTLRIVRSSVAHLLEHCVAARGLIAWEAEWERYLQHAQQRISLLSSSLTLLTSEGFKATGLLQALQESLCRVPVIFASTLICRDSTTNQIIYNRTMEYGSNQTNDFNIPPTSEGNNSVRSEVAGRLSFQSPGSASAFSFPDSALQPPPSTRSTSPSHRVSYMDISKRSQGNLSLAIDTPMSQRSADVESLKNQFGHVDSVNPALEGMEQLELVFECYEVQGSLTIYFSPEEGAATDDEADVFSPGNSTPGRAWSPSKRMPTSPYQPLRSPGAHRRALEQQRRTRINISALEAISSPSAASRAGFGNSADDQHDLVSLNALLETITRAAARRVFELHRGSKNKKMMVNKQHELSKRNSELARQGEKVQSLEAMNNMSRQELQSMAAESERMRLIMYGELRNMKEAVKQKKELNANLRQSLLELRQECDTRTVVAKKQAQELRERIRAMELSREKDQKELDRARKREVAAGMSSNTLTQQVAEMQRLQKTSDATVRQLRSDLAAAQKELAAAQARERTRTDGEDSKVQGFLQKITRLDEELVAARGTNAFLKKQLDAASLQLKMAEDRQQQGTRVSGSRVITSSTVTTNTSSSRGMKSTTGTTEATSQQLGSLTAQSEDDPFSSMAMSLEQEKEETARLRKQLQDMQSDRNRF